ncbi:hypothetical protein FACS189461_0480 [Spirochaetia bacterium]|nr:hypothetical protein FACS189461_0480 [Spirochaetia bacterium]
MNLKSLYKVLPMSFMAFFIFSLVSPSLGAEESKRSYRPREPNLLIDIPLTIAEDTMINMFGNVWWRLFGADPEGAYFTPQTIRINLNPDVWSFEVGQGGDIFIVNHIFHPYAGGMYFSAARSNNFNFYWSALSSAFGSVSYEILGEAKTPSSSDMINTVLGGMSLGEIVHRLYLELDKGGAGGKIASTMLSPTDRITAAVRGYGPEPGPSKIYDASVGAGFSWVNARFLEENDTKSTWNQPAGFITTSVVYGDPFIQQSKTPFDHFELNLLFAYTLPHKYNVTITSDGYLGSWNLADDEKNHISNGISLLFDDYIIDTRIGLNNGTENLSINANSLDYSLKWRRFIHNNVSFSTKFHAGFTPWAVVDYNGGINRDDYNGYVAGGNIKLSLELRQIKGDTWANGYETRGQSLTFNLRFFDTWTLPRTPGVKMNATFTNAELKWAFPLTEKISLYAADSFSILYCGLIQNRGAEFPDITRLYNCAQLGMQFSF